MATEITRTTKLVLQSLAMDGDLPGLKRYLKRNPTFNLNTPLLYDDATLSSNTILFLATVNCNYEMIEYLFENKLVDVNVTDEQGRTAFHAACCSYKVFIFPKLVLHRLDIGAIPYIGDNMRKDAGVTEKDWIKTLTLFLKNKEVNFNAVLDERHPISFTELLYVPDSIAKMLLNCKFFQLSYGDRATLGSVLIRTNQSTRLTAAIAANIISGTEQNSKDLSLLAVCIRECRVDCFLALLPHCIDPMYLGISHLVARYRSSSYILHKSRLPISQGLDPNSYITMFRALIKHPRFKHNSIVHSQFDLQIAAELQDIRFLEALLHSEQTDVNVYHRPLDSPLCRAINANLVNHVFCLANDKRTDKELENNPALLYAIKLQHFKCAEVLLLAGFSPSSEVYFVPYFNFYAFDCYQAPMNMCFHVLALLLNHPIYESSDNSRIDALLLFMQKLRSLGASYVRPIKQKLDENNEHVKKAKAIANCSFTLKQLCIQRIWKQLRRNNYTTGKSFSRLQSDFTAETIGVIPHSLLVNMFSLPIM